MSIYVQAQVMNVHLDCTELSPIITTYENREPDCLLWAGRVPLWIPQAEIAELLFPDSDAQQQAEADAAADSADLEREVSQGAWPR